MRIRGKPYRVNFLLRYISLPLAPWFQKKTKKTKTKPLNHGRQEKLDSLSKIQVNTFSITNPEKSSKEWNLCNENHITLNLIRISRDFIFCSSLIQHMHAKNNLKCFLLLKLFSSSDFTNDNGYFLLITKHYFSSELYRISNVQFPLFIHTFHWFPYTGRDIAWTSFRCRFMFSLTSSGQSFRKILN